MALETRTTGTLTITVVETCATTLTDAIQIELDDNINADTCFLKNQDIFLRLFFSPLTLGDDKTVDITSGVINPYSGANGRTFSVNTGDDNKLYSYSDGGGLVTLTEEILITDGAGSTTYPIYSVGSVDWVGDEPCSVESVSWSQGRNSLSCPQCAGSPAGATGQCSVTYGYIRITYTAKFECYVCNSPEAGKVLVFAYENLATDV